MQDNIREKLHEVYTKAASPCADIVDIFNEQFGEEHVDTNIMDFDKFIHAIETKTMGQLGITEYSGSNRFGSYELDPTDYATNGRGKPLLEYIPDLGILDYLTPTFRNIIFNSSNGYYVIVHFPQVRVTNEYDKYVDIQDLYAKITFSSNGVMTSYFTLTRTTFPYSHYKVHYAHSHLPWVYKNDIGTWKTPCFGSGPIYQTQNSLRNHYDKNLWGLLAYELSKYVTIESLSGGPYIRLESIDKGDLVSDFNTFACNRPAYMHSDVTIHRLLNNFIKHYAEEAKFKVKFVDGQYQLGEDPVEACIHMSNAFIDWYNNISYEFDVPSMQRLKDLHILCPYIISNGFIYTANDGNGTSVQDARDIDGKNLFLFKGNQVKLRIIISDDMSNRNTSWLFPKYYCECFITRVLSIINYKYGKRNGEKRQGETTQSNSGEKFIIV